MSGFVPLLPDLAHDAGGVVAVGADVGTGVFVFSMGIVFVATGTAALVAGTAVGTAGTSVLVGAVVGVEVGVAPSHPGG